MAQARRQFEESYREPIIFALELVDRVRAAVTEAIREDGPSDDGEYEEEIERNAWQEVTSDPSVKKQFIELAENWCNVDASSFQL
jgi:tryptophan 2,3-dioxygenase